MALLEPTIHGIDSYGFEYNLYMKRGMTVGDWKKQRADRDTRKANQSHGDTRRNTMPLYEVAAIRIPTVAEAEQGVGEKLVLPPTAIVAKDERAAIAKAFASADIGSGSLEPDRLQVLIRPFA